MISSRTLISMSFRTVINASVTLPRAPITIGTNVIFMVHISFSISSKGQGAYPSFHFLLILFYE